MAKLGVLPVVIGHVLNHRSITKSGITLGIYVQHGYESEARAALDLFDVEFGAVLRWSGEKLRPKAPAS